MLSSRKFFILLLGVICAAVFFLSREPEEEHVMVRIEQDKTVTVIPVEEYLIGAMAAVVDPEYEIECQKALAVLIRGNLERLRDGEEMVIITDEPYFDFSTRRSLYGSSQKEYEEKMEEAVLATTGLIAVSGNHILEGNYHAVSAGVTKEGPDSDRVFCDKSMEAEDFFYQKEILKEEWGSITIMEKDAGGYVDEINLNGTVVSGEYFRERMGLPSSNLDIEEMQEAYLVTTRGKGHGLGLDLYYANELAKQGYNYNQILDYFFKDFILKKIMV